MEEANEELIKRFSGLLNRTDNTRSVPLTNQAITQRNHSLCLLATVVTDRPVHDITFVSTMLRFWNIKPDIKIESVGKKTFLSEFSNLNDLLQVLFLQSKAEGFCQVLFLYP